MTNPVYDGLCGIPCLYNTLYRCTYEMGHGGDHSWTKQKTHLVIPGRMSHRDMARWYHPVPQNCRCTPLRDEYSGVVLEYVFTPDCPAHTKPDKASESST